MSNRIMKNQLSQREVYEQKYKSSRTNLLLVVVFTVINILLLVTKSGTYFLFSAYIPYFISDLGMLLCGHYPAEFYVDGLEELILFNNSFFVIMLVIASVITLLYLLAWFMSNKHRVGWLIFALVFFGLDTLTMLYLNGIMADTIIDIVFHGWIIYSLIAGIIAHYKLKKLPTNEESAISSEDDELNKINSDTIIMQASNSHILRIADTDIKYRVLLETQVSSYDICYRRVKHKNELVINGNVYDELEGVIEYPHALKAFIDGHHIAAGYTGTHSYISFNGENVAKKLRVF